MPNKKRYLTKTEADAEVKRFENEKRQKHNNRKLKFVEHPETDEYEIHTQPTDGTPTKHVRFPKERFDQMQMMPDEFIEAESAIEAYKREDREIEVYADSIESYLGYDSLLRVMNRYFGNRVAYYRSEAGGSLSYEEARKEVYRQKISNEQGVELLNKLLTMSTEYIGFYHLMELNQVSPSAAQNMWEMIKQEAQKEFESGHRAASAFEPVDYLTDAWNRASYLGLRESLIEEYQPKGGIELTMIDAVAQSWLMLQHWTEQSVKRAKTRPREENADFYNWKQWNKQASPKQWDNGYWDIPYVQEQEAIEHAAQMADRWQKMYFRAIRNLRDWRRYTPQVTINNAQQVNIAADGGQQINLAKTEDSDCKILEKK